METVKCAICGSANHELLAARARNNLKASTVICTSCGLVFLNPRMTPEEYEKFYSSAEYRKIYSQAEAPTPELDARSLRGAQEKFAFFSKNVDLEKIAPKRFLDIGCSAGYLPFVFRQKGWDAEGLEPTKSFARHGIRKFGIRIRQNVFEKEKFGKKYSFVTLIHVFEHMTSPHTALKKLRSILTEDGILYVEVPNVHEFYGRFEESCDIAHPYFYSPASLSAFLIACGFSVARIISGSSIRVFAKKSVPRKTELDEYTATKYILKKRRRDYYLKGYFIFTPLYERVSRFIAKHGSLAVLFKKLARAYSRSRLPFSGAIKQLGAVE